ncbi:MAG: DUF4191 domain-containing protein [Aeriscardovia sp.]|nr:DUF4191 domain-containing protein [Aeriscardovia sp.]
MAREEAKKKKKGAIKQLVQIYKLTYKTNKSLPWWMLLAFLVPIGVALAICFGIRFTVAWIWILVILCGVMIGFSLTSATLTQISDRAGYKRLEGQFGASAAVFSTITRGDFSFPEEPVWINRKTRDALWRGTGRAGMYLVGEGDKARLAVEMDKQEAILRRVAPGSKIPVIRIFVGNGKGRTPISKLRGTIMRKKAALTKMELNELNVRLTTMQAKQQALPRNVDPNKIKVSNRMMRRRSGADN